MYLSLYLSIHFSRCLSDYLSIYLSICLSSYLSIYLSICQAIYISIYLSISSARLCARRFSEPTFSRICIFFLLTLSLLFFSLLIFLFSLPLPCFPFYLSIVAEVWLLNFLRLFIAYPIDQVRQFPAEKVVLYLRQKRIPISLFFPYLN